MSSPSQPFLSSLPPPDGVLLVDKPSGPTSHDVVARVRRGCGKARLGHTGTLDPMATGLLVLCIGRATRLQQFLTGMDKTYTGHIRLGFATTTYDAEGEPIDPKGPAEALDDAALAREAARFQGEMDQALPPFSAKKVDGVRLYQIARRGGDVPKTSKHVRIDNFLIGLREGDLVPFELSCSSGTYVRSVAHDLGISLGCGAHVATLRRTRVGPFQISDACRPDSWLDQPVGERFRPPFFIPIDRLPLPFPRVRLDLRQSSLVSLGQPVLLRVEPMPVDGSSIALEDADGRLAAIGEAKGFEGWVEVQPRIVLVGGS